jgi:hypothetical protein
MSEEPRELSEEEMQAAFEEELKRIRVQDVLLQTVVTLVNLAGRRLGLAQGGEEERDLEQARLAIDGARALLPMCPDDQMGPVKQALSQLQMAFAQEAQSPAAPAGAPEEPPAPARPEGEDESQGDAERAKARAKIWTPPGA